MQMLRSQIGDQRFLALLAEISKRYDRKDITTEEFRLLAAWGGTLADRISRRRLVFYTQSALMALALLLAFLVYASAETVWHLLAIALAIGVVNAVDLPARLAFLVELAGKDDLVNAVGLNSLAFNLARLAGPLLLTPLLPRGGPELCFLLNGVSFLAVLAALAAMRGTAPQAAAPEADSWQALRDGARYVLGHPLLSLLLVLTTAVAMFGSYQSRRLMSMIDWRSCSSE